MLRHRSENWTTADSAKLYGIDRWGEGFFSVAPDGALLVHASPGSSQSVRLVDVVDQLQASGADLPLLIRFNDLIDSRLLQMRAAFSQAMDDTGYQGDYRCVFPIKVNQQRQVVERVLQAGQPLGFGLEAGSKPELLAVLALADNQTPIVCNGFKDADFLETAVLATKLGRQITIVIEKYTELTLLLGFARKHQTRLNIGMRIRLAARGAGRWQASGGYRSKFGLNVGEILQGVDQLRDAGFLDCFQMLHFHIGSQVTDIRHIKAALIEASRVYSHLAGLGVALTSINVGGGLGIDYDGSQSDAESSVNYTLQEYANDVVYYIQQVCDDHGVAHPDIVSESGRALVAHHAVLVVNVMGVASQVGEETPATVGPQDSQPLRILQTALDALTKDNLTESFHDGQQALDMAMTLFGVGHLDLHERMTAERQFWSLCRRIQSLMLEADETGDELDEIKELLTDTYFCNFSLFQSLPDSWAIKQIFPVLPIHRLNEPPTRHAVLGDVTCDSDGKVENFVLDEHHEPSLSLHPFRQNEPYYLGLFLVGAYQETLGDLHNLFGDTNAAHVSFDSAGDTTIDTLVKGDIVAEVLAYVQFNAEALQERFQMAIGDAIRAGRLQRAEGAEFLKLYERGLNGYTYLS